MGEGCGFLVVQEVKESDFFFGMRSAHGDAGWGGWVWVFGAPKFSFF